MGVRGAVKTIKIQIGSEFQKGPRQAFQAVVPQIGKKQTTGSGGLGLIQGVYFSQHSSEPKPV